MDEVKDESINHVFECNFKLIKESKKMEKFVTLEKIEEVKEKYLNKTTNKVLLETVNGFVKEIIKAQKEEEKYFYKSPVSPYEEVFYIDENLNINIAKVLRVIPCCNVVNAKNEITTRLTENLYTNVNDVVNVLRENLTELKRSKRKVGRPKKIKKEGKK